LSGLAPTDDTLERENTGRRKTSKTVAKATVIKIAPTRNCLRKGNYSKKKKNKKKKHTNK